MNARRVAPVGSPPPVAAPSRPRIHVAPTEGPPVTLEPSPQALRTGLECAGLLVGDTRAVLDRFAAGATQREVAARIASGSLLRKRTAHGREHLFAAIRQRYVTPSAPLQGLEPLAATLHAVRSPVARSQILLPYLLLSDRGAFEVTSDVVIPRLAARGALTKSDVVAAVDAVFARHGRRSWSVATRTRWAEGLLSVLREVGALGRGHRRAQLQPYDVRAEAFCFHLWGLYAAGLRSDALYKTPFWRLLLLSEADARRMVALVGARGWWRVRTLGATVEAVPADESLMEWLRHGVG